MITVLGASGFVGRNLIAALRREHRDVVGLSRPEFDLTVPRSFNLIPSESTVVVHAAGRIGDLRPGELWQTNVQAVAELVAYLNGWSAPPMLLYLSSGAVYGPRLDCISKSSRPNPASRYGQSKLAAERIIESTFTGKWACPRLFFPYGLGQGTPRLVPMLAARILSGSEIELNTNEGLPVVNPIFVDDLVAQLIAMLDSSQGRYPNLGGREYVSIRELAGTIGGILGSEPRFGVSAREVGNLMCEPDGRTWVPGTLLSHLAEILENQVLSAQSSPVADRK